MTAGSSSRSLTVGTLQVEFTEAGEIAAIRKGGLRVSQYVPTVHDSGTGFLAVRAPSGALIHLCGARSEARFGLSDSAAVWEGDTDPLGWTVTLRPDGPASALLWDVRLRPGRAAPAGEWRVVVAHDVALAPDALATGAEPYVSQYIAHRRVEAGPAGVAVASRQTMACAPAMPMTVLTMPDGADGFATDAFDVYTRRTRLDGAIHGRPELASRVLQYEMALPTLVSAPLTLDGEGSARIALTVDDDSGADMAAAARDAIARVARLPPSAWRAGPPPDGVSEPARSLLARAALLAGDHVEDEGTDPWGDEPDELAEHDPAGGMLSSFRGVRHVVRRAKEEAVDRAHGHILLAGRTSDPHDQVLCATAYADGVFLSHVAEGNTSLNRLVAPRRSALGVQRSAGMRILVRWVRDWRLLAVPSVFTMDIGGCRWDYRTPEGRLSVGVIADPDLHVLRLTLESDADLDAIAVLGLEEGARWRPAADGTTAVVLPAAGAPAATTCPGLAMAVVAPGTTAGDDAVLFPDAGARSAVHLTFRAERTRRLDVVLAAGLDGERAVLDRARRAARERPDVARTLAVHRERIDALVGGLRIEGSPRSTELNALVRWFAHDARVHLHAPHGLEQYSGAAWGTRDVLQGPFEFALAFGRDATARELLLTVLGRQRRDGELPQWFMHDQYRDMQQSEAHGDIVVWPLLALAQYLRSSGDTAILAEPVPFREDAEDAEAGPATVLDHLRRTLRHLREHCVPGTALPAYGGGDWDDSLQPVHARMRTDMTSSWTSALVYQACAALGDELSGVSPALAGAFRAHARRVGDDFRRHLVPGDVIAGFVDFGVDGPRPIVHPEDDRTGMRYRLIPMTRSIIAGLLEPERMRDHARLIDEQLHYPDGVRLADAPAPFQDGRTVLFRRAEQCANVGREIGLMYTHAHLRYVESLVATGRVDAADELLRISPIGAHHRVPGAAARQRNCYFSSSDADFPDRYVAAAQWHRLRAGGGRPVAVRGGWRVYSSGPGIFLRLLVEGVLGLTRSGDRLLVDPVLAAEDDGMRVRVELAGRPRTVRYRVDPRAESVVVSADGRRLPAERIAGAYRSSGVGVLLDDLGDAAVLEVVVPAGGAG